MWLLSITSMPVIPGFSGTPCMICGPSSMCVSILGGRSVSMCLIVGSLTELALFRQSLGGSLSLPHDTMLFDINFPLLIAVYLY